MVMTLSDIEKAIRSGEIENLDDIERTIRLLEEQERETNRAVFYEPNAKVEEYIRAVGEGRHKVYLLSAANGVGKSSAAVVILRNLIYGPGNSFFKLPMFEKWPFPKKFWYVTEQSNLKENIVGQAEGAEVLFNQWLPKGRFKLMKGDYSYFSHFQSDTRWTGTFKTFDMSTAKFESATQGVIILDEPPPEPIFDACVARLRQGGIMLIVMTPLADSAWVFDRVVDRMDESVGRIHMTYADIEDACQTHGIRGHLNHQHIEDMLALWKDEEIEARAHGKPTHLKGRVYKQLNRAIHIENDCDPKKFDQKHYRIYNVVDPHDARPPFITWFAVDKLKNVWAIAEFPSESEFKPFEEIGTSWNLTTREVCQRIMTVEASAGWNPSEIIRIMDPNFGHQKNSDTGKRTYQIWREHGRALRWPLHFRTNVLDALEPGHDLVREWIKPNADNHVRFKIGSNCTNLWRHMTRYAYNLRQGKSAERHGPGERVAEKYKDGCDTVRYLFMYLKGPKELKSAEQQLPEHYAMYDGFVQPGLTLVDSLNPYE
jgi:phage terminase large subunit-like protein